MKFAYTLPNGRVAIVVAAPKADLERVLGPLTDVDYERHVVERSIPAGVEYSKLPDNWTPPDDRTYRNAWTRGGAAVVVDMQKARDIHMDRIRVERDRKMTDLDREWMRHVTGKPQEAALVEAKREKLRNLPQTFDLTKATTPDELKALWPVELT